MTVFARITPVRAEQRVSILIVDTGAALGLSLVRALRHYGYEAEVTTSVAHAIGSLHRNRANVVLVHDTGLVSEKQVALLKGASSTRACIMIANQGSKLAARVRDLGVRSVPKPLEMTELLSVAKSMLRFSANRGNSRTSRPMPRQHNASETNSCAGSFTMDTRPAPDPRRRPKHVAAAKTSQPSYSVRNRDRGTLRYIPAAPG